MNLLKYSCIIGSLFLFSCSKKYCYECSATGTKSWNSSVVSAEKECDLKKGERDSKVKKFKEAHPSEEWSRTCSATSN